MKLVVKFNYQYVADVNPDEKESIQTKIDQNDVIAFHQNKLTQEINKMLYAKDGREELGQLSDFDIYIME